VRIAAVRRRRAAKRGGAWRAVPLRDAAAATRLEPHETLALGTALARLDVMDRRLRRVVELRFFDGVPERDIARMLGVSSRTVERDWVRARAFLLSAIEVSATAADRPAVGA
jgi:DNA-directed RNA polymerase specialized sigma24 family protein